MTNSNFDFAVRPSALPLALEELSQSYLAAILSGDAPAAGAIVDEALRQGVAPKIIYTRILMDAQIAVGDAWHRDEVTVADEHRATQITLDQMSRLRHTLPPRAPVGKRITITSIEGDQHFIGARLIADFFFLDGWQVDFLGTDTPFSDLVRFATREKPDVIGLSASLPEADLQNLERTVQQLKTLPHRPKIILGGSAIRESRKTFGADAVAFDPNNAISQARKLVGLSGTNASLGQYLIELGERIQTARKSMKLSQKELGESAGLDRAYISSLENGKQNVTVGALMKISEALQVPFEELLVGGPR